MNLKTTALVTGASSGIGRAIAIRLAKDGFHILIHYNRGLEGAEKTLQAIQSAGGTGELISFDVQDLTSIEQSLDQYIGLNQEAKLGVLVNNAGIHIDAMAGMLSNEAFDQVMKTNVYGPFVLMRWFSRKMLRARSGIIVNISSLAGQTGNPGQINYSASKAALIAMTKTLAMELGSRNIRVNAVAPGLIETEMLSSIPSTVIDDFKKRIPLRRLGTAEEVAGAVSFLCSPDASYITGHTISVNGGLLPT